MKHFVQIDVATGKVLQSIIVSDNDCGETNYPESEINGLKFLKNHGFIGKWIETSEDGLFRSKYANVGDVYDYERNFFYTPLAEDDIPLIAYEPKQEKEFQPIIPEIDE